jgi:hypothetical protein
MPEGKGDQVDTKLDKLIREVESSVGRLRAHATAMAQQELGQPGNGLAHRGGRLLAAIEERGGEVTTDEFYRLGKECGYADLRGLGGFFNGEQRSLEVVPATGNRRLTPIGKIHAERWRKKYGPSRLK